MELRVTTVCSKLPRFYVRTPASPPPPTNCENRIFYLQAIRKPPNLRHLRAKACRCPCAKRLWGNCQNRIFSFKRTAKKYGPIFIYSALLAGLFYAFGFCFALRASGPAGFSIPGGFFWGEGASHISQCHGHLGAGLPLARSIACATHTMLLLAGEIDMLITARAPTQEALLRTFPTSAFQIYTCTC
jgi:hypothetical protein